MILKPNEICKFSKNCEYHNSKIGLANNFCQGTNPLRNNLFECGYVDGNGKIIKEGQIRNILDVTGKMEFISEDNLNDKKY